MAILQIDEDTFVGVAAKTMRDKDVSCVLVTRKDSNSDDPIGIVTERDMLYRVLAENRGPFKVNLGRIMSCPLITIGANSSAADAVSIMRNNIKDSCTYCNSTFETKNETTRHIDETHLLDS